MCSSHSYSVLALGLNLGYMSVLTKEFNLSPVQPPPPIASLDPSERKAAVAARWASVAWVRVWLSGSDQVGGSVLRRKKDFEFSEMKFYLMQNLIENQEN
jgi:hypothetical protein